MAVPYNDKLFDDLLASPADETIAMLAMVMSSMAQVDELREIKDTLGIYLADVVTAINGLTDAIQASSKKGTE